MPSWSIDELLKFQKRQKTSDSSPSPDAELEQDSGDAPHGEGKVPPFVRGEFTVRFTSVRKRLLDHDDNSIKYLLDALARAKLPEEEGYFIIPGDAPYHVSTEVRQRKCRKGEPEHIVIDVYPTAEGPDGATQP